MKRIILQAIIILCVIAESILIFRAMASSDIICQELYAGLAILVLLTIIRLINNLTNITYGNPEEN